MKRIDQNSLIPIGLAVVVIGGGAAWMTKQEFNQTANAAEIRAVKDSVHEQYKRIEGKLGEALQRLSSIEGELRRIPKRTGETPEE